MFGNNAGNSIRKKGNKRDSYFQAIRGICILMVIYIHSAAGDKGAPWELNYWIAVRQFCSIAVALFLVLSGYFSADSIGGQSRYRKLLIPYLCWSAFYAVVNNLDSLQLGDCVKRIMTGRASVQLYFILVLVQLNLITPLLKRAIGSKAVSALILMASPAYFMFFNFLQLNCGFETDWKGRVFCAWVSYYYLGMLFRAGRLRVPVRRCTMLAAVGLALCFTEGFYFSYTAGYVPMGVGQLKVGTFLLACGVAGFLFASYGKIHFPPGIIEVGNDSYGIFYLHTFVLKCENVLLRSCLGAGELPLPVIHAIQVSATAVICILVIRLARKCIKKKDILLWIGFV